MALLSVSRRTDIPAFYGDWFIARLMAGFAAVRQPFNGLVRQVDLRPEAVEGIIFWSKDYRPLLPRLDEIRRMGYAPFVFQFTINDAPGWLEPNVPLAAQSVEVMCELARRFGVESTIWRFDPIIITRHLDAEHHLDRFLRLADVLTGATRRVTVSFVDNYRKTARNLSPVLAARGDEILDLPLTSRREMVARMADEALSRGIRLSVCCEPDLVSWNIPMARCVDPAQFTALGRPVKAVVRPTREGCGCYAAVDIGAYNTCAHGCLYCYANSDPETAHHNREQIRPQGAGLGIPELPGQP